MLHRFGAVMLLLRAMLAAVLLCRDTGAAPVILDESFREVTLGAHLDLAVDPTGVVTIDQVVAGVLDFQASTAAVPNVGFRGGALWARMRVDGVRAASMPVVLVLDYPPLDELRVFTRTAEGVHETARLGDTLPFASRWIPIAQPNVRLVDDGEIYLRAQSTSSLQLPVRLVRMDALLEDVAKSRVAIALFFGCMLIMLAYNVLLAVRLRSADYAWYCSYVASFIVFEASVEGWGYEFVWPASPLTQAIVTPISLGWLTATMTWLAASFTRIRERSKAVTIVSRCGAAAAATVGTLSPFFGYGASIRILAATGVICILANLVSALLAARQGQPGARWFLIGFGSILLGLLAYTLRSAGLLPSNWLTLEAPKLGAVIDVTLLSFALAERIESLQQAATSSATLAAANAELARSATAKVLEEQERANAELKRLDKLKDEFLANTSHELRTPLNGVIGLTESVLNTEVSLSDAAKQRLNLVLRSGRRLSSLVNDLLDFSKLQRGEFEVQSAPFALSPVVREVLEVLSPSAEQKSLRLRAQVPEGLAVVADAARVRQILTNLVGNAIKFTERGSVRVEAAQLGERVLVRVADTGIGIPADAHERIFVAFEQADGGTARKHGGTGLGLSVTKQLVELHGGSIRVESAEGKGSAFTFEVAAAETADRESLASLKAWEPEVALPPRPVSDAPRVDAALANARSSVKLVSRDRKSVRVLVADDDPINLEVLRAVLEPAGYMLVTANDGREAVARAFDSGPFDAVLLDVMMPRMTGLEAATVLRADFPQGTLPILMLTAKNRPEDVVAGLAAGADDYLGKPVNSAELLARLGAHIEGLRAMKAVERLVSPGMVSLAEASHASGLAKGQGSSRGVGILRIAFHGLEALAARADEHTLFTRYQEVIAAIVTGLRDHGAVIESAGDHQLCFLVPVVDDAFLRAVPRVLESVAPKLSTSLRVGAALHFGHVKIGVLGDDEWVSVRALGQAVYLCAALAAWSARRGFSVLLTDACVARLDTRSDMRRIGTARLSAEGHPVTVYELPDSGTNPATCDAVIDHLEKGRFDTVLGALEGADERDALVQHLREAASVEAREIVLGRR
jgi:signal transduction histidine kinase/CheY-like chemotaxis protein